MQRGKHDEIARPLFEHRIKVPDLEMPPHPDQQRTLANPAPRAHPRRDPEPPLAVHRGWRDEPQPSPQQRIARAAFVTSAPAAAYQIRTFPVLVNDIVPIVNQQAGIVGVKPDEQVLPRAARLYRHAEMIGKKEFATRADRRDRASHEEIVHDVCILNAYTVSTQIPAPGSRIIVRGCFADTALMTR